MVHCHHLATVLGCKHIILSGSDVYSLVHLLLAFVHRVLTHTEWRGNKQEIVSFYRKWILSIGFLWCNLFVWRWSRCSSYTLSVFCCYRSRCRISCILLHPELLLLSPHLLHHLLVILLQPICLNDFLQTCCIPSIGRITAALNAFCPSFIVIWR